MTEEAPRKVAPIPLPKYNKVDVAAIQALANGEATPEQQRHALQWIVNSACDTYGFCDKPQSERLSAIHSGRVFAGQQIVKLYKINMSAVFKSNTNTNRGE